MYMYNCTCTSTVLKSYLNIFLWIGSLRHLINNFEFIVGLSRYSNLKLSYQLHGVSSVTRQCVKDTVECRRTLRCQTPQWAGHRGVRLHNEQDIEEFDSAEIRKPPSQRYKLCCWWTSIKILLCVLHEQYILCTVWRVFTYFINEELSPKKFDPVVSCRYFLPRGLSFCLSCWKM